VVLAFSIFNVSRDRAAVEGEGCGLLDTGLSRRLSNADYSQRILRTELGISETNLGC
jgi:hypothetical protein